MPTKRAAGAGRKPAGDFTGKSSAFSTRITPDLRDALDRESADTGKSVSQIVERRLRESYAEPKRMANALGEQHVRALAYLVARLTTSIESITRTKWNEDVFTYRAVKAAIGIAVLNFHPTNGDYTVPGSLKDEQERLEIETGRKDGFADVVDPESFGASHGRAFYTAMKVWRDLPMGAEERQDLDLLMPFIRNSTTTTTEGKK